MISESRLPTALAVGVLRNRFFKSGFCFEWKEL